MGVCKYMQLKQNIISTISTSNQYQTNTIAMTSAPYFSDLSLWHPFCANARRATSVGFLDFFNEKIDTSAWSSLASTPTTSYKQQPPFSHSSTHPLTTRTDTLPSTAHSSLNTHTYSWYGIFTFFRPSCNFQLWVSGK